LARRESATPYMVLLAAFQVLLSRWSGMEDVVVGTPIAGRTRAETEGVIGMFVNTLALRTDLCGDPAFTELLGRVREGTLGAYAHQELPFERLVDELQPERTLSHSPLFQVMFVLQNTPGGALEIPGATVTPLERELGGSQFDLTLTVAEREHGWRAAVQYSTDLFDDSTIRRMLDRLGVLLAGIAASPAERIAALPLLPAEEAARIASFGAAGRGFPATGTLHGRFSARAERSPGAVAVVSGEERLTYAELDRRADRLARRLRALGVGPEVRVALCLERGLEMLVSLLAVLRAGGAYVPLDPAYPPERLRFLLEDSGARVLLAREAFLPRLSPFSGATLCPERERLSVEAHADTALPETAGPQSLAYVIYTSGSTGAPKGVEVTHANVLRLFRATEEGFGFGAEDVWTLFHSYAFDFSVWELWGALLYGGRLVVVPREVSRDPEAFRALLVSERVTVLNQTPSAFQQLMGADEGKPDDLSLRYVVFGGEALEPGSLRPWFARHGDERPRLVNMYGITETTVHVTCRPLTREDVDAGSASPIGRPLPDLCVQLLDRHLQPAPVGVPGEMYVGGAGVARGYLNRPELTAQRFLPDPFSAEAGARLYRSGDRARWLASGELEYLGRADQQVKVRGFRIEPGEIEAVLRAHAGERLPEHMVPGAFVSLEALPLTVNGKLDLRALPAPEAGRSAVEGVYAAPESGAEEILARVWAEVLRLERVGIHDNFFQLGGDSILAIQVVSRAHRAGLRLSAKQLFQHQTVAALARVAEVAAGAGGGEDTAAGPVPPTPIQRWFFAQELPDPHHYNQAVLLAPREPLDPEHLRTALSALLERHGALRLRFARGPEGWSQRYGEGETELPLEAVDLSDLPEGEQDAGLETTAAGRQAGLELENGPLLRAVHFCLGARRGERLLLVIHHLAVDGVSWRILLEELETAYRQLARGETVALPPRTTSFRRWAERLHAYARSEAPRAELPFWTRQARGTAPLPVDFAGGENTVGSARTVRVALSEEETRALLTELPAAYRTQVNDVLLCGLLQAFHRWTGERSLRIDLEGHGREELFADVDLSRTVGWFTSLFPVRLELEEGGPGEALKAVKEQLRAVPQRGVGYGVLRHLSDDPEVREALCGAPQPEVLFNYLGQVDPGAPGASLFTPAGEGTGPSRGPRGRRGPLLEINGLVSGGRLQLAWRYGESLHLRSTVERLAASHLDALRGLVEHCRAPEAGGYTPSDFPRARLNQKDLDKLARLRGGPGPRR
ncbi:MAG TPA: amino acid adenylation domain-containing protein, partial [Longimicrobiaceae bacterium]|nr:amino acid adenylation domain-containing protein [Longimicrobiaceae bacterium]